MYRTRPHTVTLRLDSLRLSQSWNAANAARTRSRTAKGTPPPSPFTSLKTAASPASSLPAAAHPGSPQLCPAPAESAVGRAQRRFVDLLSRSDFRDRRVPAVLQHITSAERTGDSLDHGGSGLGSGPPFHPVDH